MGKMRDYEAGRADGLDLAVRIVRDGGLEALEKEIKFRGITGINTSLAKKDLDKAATKIKEMTMDLLIVLGVAALHDEFGFGEKRCQRWMDKVSEGADYIADDMAQWKDYIDAIRENIGLELDVRWS